MMSNFDISDYINTCMFVNNRKILSNSISSGVIRLISRGCTEDTLQEVMRCAVYTFTIEEYWMKNLAYPRLKLHIKGHRKIIKKVFSAYAAYCQDNSLGRATYIYHDLKKEFEKHISSEDLGFIEHAISTAHYCWYRERDH